MKPIKFCLTKKSDHNTTNTVRHLSRRNHRADSADSKDSVISRRLLKVLISTLGAAAGKADSRIFLEIFSSKPVLGAPREEDMNAVKTSKLTLRYHFLKWRTERKRNW